MLGSKNTYANVLKNSLLKYTDAPQDPCDKFKDWSECGLNFPALGITAYGSL